ncbi:Unknown protein, partial [Striga hermonthica]
VSSPDLQVLHRILFARRPRELSGSLTDFTQQSVITLWDMGHRRMHEQSLSPRRLTLVSGGRPFVIVLSHPPQLSHLQLHQLYQLLSQQRRRRGRERVHRLIGGLDSDSSRFHRARLVVDFTGESAIWDRTSATTAMSRDILLVAVRGDSSSSLSNYHSSSSHDSR